ncbi:hypothetical protein [Effusibacillus dendaii]|uniref:hypothetical protein n=1 Tax=Effusibacillus dendaii TaxID=2743772 RepID=UPI0019092EAD|nr:hypothetical protein [Effusibacillus dendaii]
MNLLEGEAVKFKPFMGLHSGGVHLRYQGKKSKIQAEMEVWENGVKTKTAGMLSQSILERGTDTGKYAGDFIFSVKEEKNEKDTNGKYQITYGFVDKNGYSSSETMLDKLQNYTMQSTLQLNGAKTVADSNSTIVFGFQATDENGLTTYGSMEETIQKAKWAWSFGCRLLIKGA